MVEEKVMSVYDWKSKGKIVILLSIETAIKALGELKLTEQDRKYIGRLAMELLKLSGEREKDI